LFFDAQLVRRIQHLRKSLHSGKDRLDYPRMQAARFTISSKLQM
jgi:hypothetical protein